MLASPVALPREAILRTTLDFSKANILQTFKSIRKPVEGIAINYYELLKFTVQRRNCSS